MSTNIRTVYNKYALKKLAADDTPPTTGKVSWFDSVAEFAKPYIEQFKESYKNNPTAWNIGLSSAGLLGALGVMNAFSGGGGNNNNNGGGGGGLASWALPLLATVGVGAAGYGLYNHYNEKYGGLINVADVFNKHKDKLIANGKVDWDYYRQIPDEDKEVVFKQMNITKEQFENSAKELEIAQKWGGRLKTLEDGWEGFKKSFTPVDTPKDNGENNAPALNTLKKKLEPIKKYLPTLFPTTPTTNKQLTSNMGTNNMGTNNMGTNNMGTNNMGTQYKPLDSNPFNNQVTSNA